jgi:type IX secretion system PorP/SprF family membrane protein
MLLAPAMVFGQQLPIYSQYLYNKFLINPAVAGSDGYTRINLTARQQWLGYSGAPRTFALSFQGRILKKKYQIRQGKNDKSIFRPRNDGRVGLGGYIFSDKNGLVYRNGFQASYAYHLWLNGNTQFSMGLSFNGYHFRINRNEINFTPADMSDFNNDLFKGIFVSDFSFGTYLLNYRYNLGFSADQLMQGLVRTGSTTYKMKRQYNFFGSYDFSSGFHTIIQPSLLVIMWEQFDNSQQFKPLADIGVTYIRDQDFWVGMTYRTSNAIITNIGVRKNNIFIGYSVDFTLSAIQRVTYGTHELTLAFKFGDSSRKYRWLDRY